MTQHFKARRVTNESVRWKPFLWYCWSTLVTSCSSSWVGTRRWFEFHWWFSYSGDAQCVSISFHTTRGRAITCTFSVTNFSVLLLICGSVDLALPTISLYSGYPFNKMLHFLIQRFTWNWNCGNKQAHSTMLSYSEIFSFFKGLLLLLFIFLSVVMDGVVSPVRWENLNLCYFHINVDKHTVAVCVSHTHS